MTNDLKDQVHDYAEFFLSTVESVEPGEITERPFGEGPVRPMGPLPVRRRGGVLAAAAAAAAVLVVVGGLASLIRLGGAPTPQGEPTPTTVTTSVSPDTTTPDSTTPPTTVPAGPVEVTVEWARVTNGNPPLNGPIERGFGPFIITDTSPQRVAVVSGFDDGPLSLWSSEDGIRWVNSAISLPVEPAWLAASPPGYWLVGGDPTELWHAPTLDHSWRPVNLDGLVQQAPYPFTFDASIESVAPVGDTALIVARYSAEFDWDAILGIEPGTYQEYDYNWEGDEESPFEKDPDELSPIVTLSGRNENVDPSDSEVWIEEPLLRFVPSTSAEGLSIIDADTGETVFVFPNVGDLDWANVVGLDAFPRFQTEFFTLLEVTPDGLEPTGPWAGSLGSLNSLRRIRTLQLNDAIIVETVVNDPTENTIVDGQRENYLTRDGRTFERIPPSPQGLLNINYDPISGYLYSGLVDGVFTGTDVLEHWISTDGVNWTTLQTPVVLEDWFVQRSVLHRLDGAWMIMKDAGGITEIYVSVDGEEWHAIDPPPSIDWPIPLAPWGNRLLIFGEESNWIGTVDISDG